MSGLDIKYVTPSGDTNGDADRIAIRVAKEELQGSPNTRGQLLIVLAGGPYYINDVDPDSDSEIIALGDRDENVYPVSLRSAHLSTVKYVGAATSRYLFSVQGSPNSPTQRMAGMFIDCSGNCRGIYLYRQTYMSSVENVMVHNAREVGVDWVSSYKARAKDLHINYTRGVGLRVWRSQGAVFDSLRIANSATTMWPSENDQSVIDDTGAYVQTPVAERSFVHNHSREIVYRSMMFERNVSGPLPISFISSYSRGVRFTEQLYFELNSADNEKFLIQGSSINQSKTRHFKFENVKMSDEPCTTFIRQKGFVADTIVEHIHGDKLDNVVVCDGGTSYNISVRGSAVNVDEANIVTSVGGGIIDANSPSSEDMQGPLIPSEIPL